jgi:hypothetical protein
MNTRLLEELAEYVSVTVFYAHQDIAQLSSLANMLHSGQVPGIKAAHVGELHIFVFVR